MLSFYVSIKSCYDIIKHIKFKYIHTYWNFSEVRFYNTVFSHRVDLFQTNAAALQQQLQSALLAQQFPLATAGAQTGFLIQNPYGQPTVVRIPAIV